MTETNPTMGGDGLVERYDAGLLNDYGGGNVEWWWDYIRAELERSHDFYSDQITTSEALVTSLRNQLDSVSQSQPCADGERAARADAEPAGVPEVEYELECNGMWVASCCGPSALAEIRHYAMQYASEGPCEIFVVTKYRAPLSAHLDAERSDKPRETDQSNPSLGTGGEALSKSQSFLLDWLSKEDSSAYGECLGRDLKELVARGLAVVGDLPEGVPNGYQRVSLTDKGRAMIAAAPPPVPSPGGEGNQGVKGASRTSSADAPASGAAEDAQRKSEGGL